MNLTLMKSLRCHLKVFCKSHFKLVILSVGETLKHFLMPSIQLLVSKDEKQVNCIKNKLKKENNILDQATNICEIKHHIYICLK